jgi:adenylate cyclase
MVAEHNQHCEQTLMFTDIVGYSRLMGRNESMAIEMLGDYRKILLSHIEQQGGQLVEFIGDAIFARFDSAASATAAAIAIQQHLQAFNEVRDKKLPPLQTRIGLHKGEVMLRDGAVFGDSVNIAARLEPLAVADGICISQTVYDEIRFTLSSPAKRLGVQALKNIEQKIRVYLIKPSGIGWRDHLFYFLRGLNKKIVAYRYPLTACLFALIIAGFYFIPRWLVPGYAANYVEIADFQNLMNEKGDADYFSAGITEAVRSQLADMRDVYIVDAKEGIHAPIRLEGSVQRLGDNLRIAYRLFRRKDNVQIAGGKLDGKYQDIFILQDRLVGEIARYLADEFDLQNFRPAPLRLTGDVTAYDYYLRGLEDLNAPATQQRLDLAIQNFSVALIHDSSFVRANIGMCKSYWKKYSLSSSVKWLNDAESFCLIAIDSGDVSVYGALGAIYRDTGRHDMAIDILQEGIKIDDDSLSLSLVLSTLYDVVNRKDEAESIFKKMLSKYPGSWQVYDEYGVFLTKNGRFRDAIRVYEKLLNFEINNFATLNNIGANYFYLGDLDSAAKAFENAAKLEPAASVYSNSGCVYYYAKDYKKAVEMYQEALRMEPDNYKWMSHLADAYKYLESDKFLADKYFEYSIRSAESAIKLNPNVDRVYHYLAIGLGYFGQFEDAKSVLSIAEKLNPNSVDLYYAKLRVAVFDNDKADINAYYRRLKDLDYPENLISLDPDFQVLHENVDNL